MDARERKIRAGARAFNAHLEEVVRRECERSNIPDEIVPQALRCVREGMSARLSCWMHDGLEKSFTNDETNDTGIGPTVRRFIRAIR